MTRETIYRDGDRDFLNQPGFHTEATVAWYVEVKRTDDKIWNDGSFDVRDCSNTISLQLDYHSHEYFENTLTKLDRLIQHARRCKQAIREARKVYLKNEDKAK